VPNRCPGGELGCGAIAPVGGSAGGPLVHQLALWRLSQSLRMGLSQLLSHRWCLVRRLLGGAPTGPKEGE